MSTVDICVMVSQRDGIHRASWGSLQAQSPDSAEAAIRTICRCAGSEFVSAVQPPVDARHTFAIWTVTVRRPQ